MAGDDRDTRGVYGSVGSVEGQINTTNYKSIFVNGRKYMEIKHRLFSPFLVEITRRIDNHVGKVLY